MTATTTAHVPAFGVPRYTSAQACRDYAQRAAERYRSPIRELWNRGVRRPGEIAASLNRLDILSPTGRPWASRAVARVLKLLRFDRVADAHREADTLEGLTEELWGLGYRVPRHLGRVLERLEIPRPGGGAWNARAADRLLQHHRGEWMADGACVRLRHGDDALTLGAFPDLPKLPALERRRAAPSAALPVILEPREPAPRRRAIRVRSYQ